MYRSVIFDMDGVLLDTEKIYQHFWHQAAEDMGVELTDEMALSLRSLDAGLAAERFAGWFGDTQIYAKMKEHRITLMDPYLESHNPVPKAGVRETIAFLKEKDIPYAIATATKEDKAWDCLEMAGIADLFDVIVSAKTVPRGKPFPDVYLYACRAIGRDPKECLAVEDSPNGLLSARRAGCVTAFVPDLTQYTKELEDRTDYALTKLTDLCNEEYLLCK